MLKLLAALAASGEVSAAQAFKGFHRLVDQLDDLALDMPGLQAAFHTLCADAVAAGAPPLPCHPLHVPRDTLQACIVYCLGPGVM